MLTEIDINSPPPPPQKVGSATNRVTFFRYLDHPPGRRPFPDIKPLFLTSTTTKTRYQLSTR